MRTLRACLAAAALVAAGGCLGDGGKVTLTFDQQSSVTPAITAFNASDGTAVEESDHFIHFTATSPQGTITMLIVPPLNIGDMVDLSAEHNVISFDRGGTPAAGWSNNTGTLMVLGVSPYKLQFEAVPMLPGSGASMGSFVVNGSGTFK
ncbi:MAG TPA: hypothetical protein VGL86_05725 [Polyangia bacterium]|jgi:hypothetical protein